VQTRRKFEQKLKKIANEVYAEKTKIPQLTNMQNKIKELTNSGEYAGTEGEKSLHIY
jgi:hypothetical protein